jgi:hypothetical protein
MDSAQIVIGDDQTRLTGICRPEQENKGKPKKEKGLGKLLLMLTFLLRLKKLGIELSLSEMHSPVDLVKIHL